MIYKLNIRKKNLNVQKNTQFIFNDTQLKLLWFEVSILSMKRRRYYKSL